jgi:hypothetical protein
MKMMWKCLKSGNRSSLGDHKWKLGKWYEVDGKINVCEHGFHASEYIQDAMSHVAPDIIALVEVDGAHADADEKSAWEKMRVVKTWRWTTKMSVFMAIFCAELVIAIYKNTNSADDRPRAAIDAAKAWLINPSPRNAKAAGIAAKNVAITAIATAIAAIAAANDAAANAAYAAYAASCAANAAAAANDAAIAAISAAAAAAYATNAAANDANANAANAENAAETKQRINNHIVTKLLKYERVYFIGV